MEFHNSRYGIHPHVHHVGGVSIKIPLLLVLFLVKTVRWEIFILVNIVRGKIHAKIFCRIKLPTNIYIFLN